MTPRTLAAAVVALLGLLAGHGLATERGDITIERKSAGMGDIPPAVFGHWVHRMQYRCPACHDELFKMKAGANDINMTAIQGGQFCGKCHNGKIAFPSTFATCSRCHRK